MPNQVYGVDVYEAGAAQNLKTKVAHAGWVGIITYNDMHGNYRVKSEVLVASGTISTSRVVTYSTPGDAPDDAFFRDSYIVISVQPQNASVSVGTTQVLSVTAAAIPGAPVTYQWLKSTTAGGGTFASIGGATSATVSIANTNTDNNGFRYAVDVSSAGAATVRSELITLSVA
jgi:hypothetical protein